MKLADFAARAAQQEEGAVINLQDETGEDFRNDDGQPITLTIVGAESKRYRAAEDEISRELLRSRRASAEPADLKRRRIKLAASAVTEWTGLKAEDGSPLPCSQENVRALLSYAENLAQVEDVIKRHKDFFSKRSSN